MATVTKPNTVIEISILSSEPIRIPVYVDADGIEVDPTTMSVSMAFKVDSVDPLIGDWVSGTWDKGEVFSAQAIPPVSSLGKGTYVVWLRIVGATSPVRAICYLRVI